MKYIVELEEGETVTKTCLDCANLDIDRMPTPGHVCYECKGQLVAVKANGSNFEDRDCGNCAKYDKITCVECHGNDNWEKK